MPWMPSKIDYPKVCALSSAVRTGMKPFAFRCGGSYKPLCFSTLNPWFCSVNSVKLAFLPCLPPRVKSTQTVFPCMKLDSDSFRLETGLSLPLFDFVAFNFDPITPPLPIAPSTALRSGHMRLWLNQPWHWPLIFLLTRCFPWPLTSWGQACSRLDPLLFLYLLHLAPISTLQMVQMDYSLLRISMGLHCCERTHKAFATELFLWLL